MKVVVALDGERREVVVDLDGSTATIDGVVHPVKRVRESGESVELEVDGERVVVDLWPAGLGAPDAPISVNGEIVEVGEVQVAASVGPVPPPISSPTPRGPAVSARTSPSEGTAIVPPMPGKVIELKVSVGDSVRAGQVVVVLEAMKMRNEVTTPVAGRVAEIRVTVGANVRAREPMLSVVPQT